MIENPKPPSFSITDLGFTFIWPFPLFLKLGTQRLTIVPFQLFYSNSPFPLETRNTKAYNSPFPVVLFK